MYLNYSEYPLRLPLRTPFSLKIYSYSIARLDDQSTCLPAAIVTPACVTRFCPKGNRQANIDFTFPKIFGTRLTILMSESFKVTVHVLPFGHGFGF